MTTNDDGSVDIRLGPEPPAAGHENWIQTVAGKGWFLVLRLYGPLEPWFEWPWRPGDLEQLDRQGFDPSRPTEHVEVAASCGSGEPRSTSTCAPWQRGQALSWATRASIFSMAMVHP